MPLLIAGVDEAGRGPLAGPVAAAAVILDPAAMPEGLNDSKKLSEAARERLFPLILLQAKAVAFSFASPGEIDQLNIRGATLLAMRRAVLALSLAPDQVLVDGRDVPPGLPCAGRAIVGGDALEPAISAASIVAKVMRDRLMVKLGREFPAYGFEKHMGYGTARHLEALRLHGPSAHHRLSFAPCRNGTH
ncbi:MAG: ribonuclease HII [Beijerinckiaceae bacterium]